MGIDITLLRQYLQRATGEELHNAHKLSVARVAYGFVALDGICDEHTFQQEIKKELDVRKERACEGMPTMLQ